MMEHDRVCARDPKGKQGRRGTAGGSVGAAVAAAAAAAVLVASEQRRGERGKEESARKKDRDPSARAVQPLFDTRNMDTRGGFRTLKA